MIQALHFIFEMIRYGDALRGFRYGAALAAPDPSTASQAGAFPGEDLAAAAGVGAVAVKSSGCGRGKESQ
jgi:hypothetical protein